MTTPDATTSPAIAETARTVHVALPGRAYDVLIGPGLLGHAGKLVAGRLGARKCAIVTDENVARHHVARLERALADGCKHAGTIVLPPGEATKCFAQLAPLSERLLELGIERGDFVVALGGGVIGDLAGFAASILRRGVRMVQMPTSLLAQVDSSVGGKTGINTPQGKNLIGTFHQPSLVLADTDVLTTLPPREMRAGYAEVAKYGLLGDAPFFDWLEKNWRSVFGNDVAALMHAIEVSVQAKAAIVLRDEHETGDRALLNLGHTFGHALEAWTGYSSRLLHGEGVSIGMAQAFRFSEELKLCPAGTAARVEAHLKAVGLPTRLADIPGGKPDADHLVALMGQDKKVRDGRLTFILARGIGQAFITRDIERDQVRAFLTREIGGYHSPSDHIPLRGTHGIQSLTTPEIAEVTKMLEAKLGMSTPATVAAGPAATTQTEFTVVLKSGGDKKINVIEEVRAITGLGLKEAKDLVEAGSRTVKENVSKDEAAKIKKQLEDHGAKVEVK